MGTVTPAMVTAAFESARFRVLAVHGDDLGLAAPYWRNRALAALRLNYHQVAMFPRIGHFANPLFVFVRNGP